MPRSIRVRIQIQAVLTSSPGSGVLYSALKCVQDLIPGLSPKVGFTLSFLPTQFMVVPSF